MSKEVATKLHQVYLKALADKGWTQRMTDVGIHLLPETQYTPEALVKHTTAEVANWRKVAADAKICDADKLLAAGYRAPRVRAGGRDKVNRLDAREVAKRTLHWWLQDVCSGCDGVKYERVPGTPKLSARLCTVCQGVGRYPLTSIVKPKHLEHSRWLASELDALCGYVMADMARLLGQAMDLE